MIEGLNIETRQRQQDMANTINTQTPLPKKSAVKKGLSTITKLLLVLLIILIIGLAIFLVNAWQQLNRANQMANEQPMSDTNAVEVLTPNGESPNKNINSNLLQSAISDNTDTIAASAPDELAPSTIDSKAKPAQKNITITPNDATNTPIPAKETVKETVIEPINVSPKKITDTPKSPSQQQNKDAMDDLF